MSNTDHPVNTETAAERRTRHLDQASGYRDVPADEVEAIRRAHATRAPLEDPQQLTAGEWDALRSCRAKGGKPVTELGAETRRRLLNAGWIVQHGDTLLITKAGRAAENTPVRKEEIATLLRQGWGTTTDPSKAVPGEPEVLNASDPKWRRATREGMAEASDRRDRRGTRGLRRAA